MTKDECKQLYLRICATYPNFKPDNIEFSFGVWYEMLESYDYQAMLISLKAYVASDTSGFAPSIGQLIAKMNEIKSQIEGTDLNEMQAWGLVSGALRDSLYHAKERFDELPESVKKAVGSPETLRAWAIGDNYNENVAQSHFISTYRSVKEQEKKFKALPQNIQNLITKTMNTQGSIEDNGKTEVKRIDSRGNIKN